MSDITMDATGTTPTASASIDLERAAYFRTAAQRDTVDLAHAPQYNLDAMYAAAQAQAMVRRLEPYRGALATLPGFDMAHLDGLADLASALVFVQATLVSRATRHRQLPALAAEGFELRAMMLTYCDLLALRNAISPKVVAKLREGTGYRDLIEDLAAIAVLLQNTPGAIGPTSAVTEAEVERAAEISRQMRLELGSDADPDLTHEDLIQDRRKLATLLLRSHDQLRRAMTYLRWSEGDAVALVPHLHVPQKNRRKKSTQDETDPAAQLAAIHDALHEHEHHHDFPEDLNPFID